MPARRRSWCGCRRTARTRLTIIAYTAEPGSPARQALDLLASRTNTPDNLRVPQEHTDLAGGTPPPIRSEQ